MDARSIIWKEYGLHSRNFMTPNLIRIASLVRGRVAYELSYGEGLRRGTTIYGVSIARYDPATDSTERLYDLSQSFQSKDAAERYIEELKDAFQWYDDPQDVLRSIKVSA